jgi:acyl-CoA thioester hydrolase
VATNRVKRAIRFEEEGIVSGPLLCPPRTVERAWIDYNGHMNMAYYNLVFDQALDYVFDTLGIGAAYVRDRKGSLFTVEIHVHYLQELSLGDPIRVQYQLLDWDDKRIHYYGELYHGTEGYLSATSEQLALHVDMRTRKATAFPDDIAAGIDVLMCAHAALPRPERVGHVMSIAPEKSNRGRTPKVSGPTSRVQ